MRTFAIAVLVALLCPVAAGAIGSIGCYADVAGTDPAIIAAPGTVVDIPVVMWTPDNVDAVSFLVVGDADFQGHTIYLSFDTPGYTTTGSASTGVTVSFDGCKTGTFLVGTLHYLVTSSLQCGLFWVRSGLSSPGVETALCGGGTSSVGGQESYFSTHENYYANRYPADGATGVPLDVSLTWDLWYCYAPGDCFEDCWYVAFGTDPDNLTHYPIGSPFAPGPLEPNTTYYWYIQWYPVSGSPTWSFTTADDIVATERTTWGVVKSRYR